MKFGIEGKKGQAAIEYLATYGWAILLISIVGVVVWKMGILTPPPPPPDCRGFSQIRPIDWSFDSKSGDFSIVIVNEANTKLRINANGVSTLIENQGACSTAPNSDINISAGGKAQINISNCPASSINSGGYYKAKINITYYNVASGMTHISIGTCWGSAE